MAFKNQHSLMLLRITRWIYLECEKFFNKLSIYFHSQVCLMDQNFLPTKQDNLDVKIKCSAISEAVVMNAEIVESISNLFKADVFLQTTKQIDTDKLLNSAATISLSVGDNTHYFSGIIDQASFENIVTASKAKVGNILYIRIVPTLSRTKFSQKYRSFQEQTAKDIIQKILKEHNIVNSKMNLKSAGNVKREFCVQYGESDFHFISRLMEEEGMFYYFEQVDNQDILHISDLSSACSKIKTALKIRKYSTSATVTPDSVYNVSFQNSIGTKKIEAFSYNDQKAEVITGMFSDSSDKTKFVEKEFFDPAFTEKGTGNDITKIMTECENSISKKLTGCSYCPEIFAGSIFNISGSATEKHNGEFLTVSVRHYINQIPEKTDTPIYYNSFIAIPRNIPFRPTRTHLKNRIFGCQTAVVTGISEEEIFCDDESRIKVKFHWDSRTKNDEKSSCWIRVAQTWAGNNFGSLIIPRVGMEVVVQFINGDPDQPIVVGCLYNGVNKTPNGYAKDQKTVSTFKTNSTKGNGFNELRFNDKADEEEIFIHGQKNVNSIIENNFTETLNEGSKSVTLESKKQPVEHSLHIKKGNNILTLNEGDYVIVLDKGNQSVTIKEGNQTIVLSKGNLKVDITGSLSIKASDDINIETKGALNLKAEKAISIDSKDAVSLNSAKDLKIGCLKMSATAKTAMELSALTFKCESKTTMQFDALSVKITAKTVLDLTAMAAATVKATAMLQLQGTAGIALQGAMIKLN